MSDLYEDVSSDSQGEVSDAKFEDPITPIGPTHASIGGWTIDRYVALTRWPVLIAAGIAAALAYVGVTQPTIFGIELLVFIVLGWMVSIRNGGRSEAIATGMIAGVGLGFLVSIVRLLLNPELIFVVNIVAETMLTAIIGGLLTICVSIVYKIIFRST